MVNAPRPGAADPAPLGEGRKDMEDEDRQLRQRVLAELDWDPRVDAGGIGVAAKDGVVTLTGHVASYAEKLAAERATRRLRGVRAIAQEIEVRLAAAAKTADHEIASRALRILAWDSQVPAMAVSVTVEKGWVTLAGLVDWEFQRVAAERAVQKLGGVTGVTNLVQVHARPQMAGARAADLRRRIEEAFRRDAMLDAGRVTVTIADVGRVALGGRVQSWREREAAARAAWSAPGVVAVEDRISVG
jgi:osmotically-inducible protein OsmY